MIGRGSVSVIFACGVLVFCAAPTDAVAQNEVVAEKWLIVSAATEEKPTAKDAQKDDPQWYPLSEQLAGELVQTVAQVWRTKGHLVMDTARAVERFVAVESAPASELSQRDISRWSQRSKSAIEYIARQDYRRAQKELAAAQQTSTRASEALNREAARAQLVLDTCLYLVRAFLETNRVQSARDQIRQCRKLIPRVEPSAYKHTPEVRDLLAQVDAEMRDEEPGQLHVQSAPSGCMVRINGVPFGRTPLAKVELPAGEYRLQVECDDVSGRVHLVTVKSGQKATIDVDAIFDRAIRTRGRVALSYPKTSTARARYARDALRIGNLLDLAGVLVVRRVEPKSVRIDLISAQKTLASVWLPITDGARSRLEHLRLSDALDALLAGESTDYRGEQPQKRSGIGPEAISSKNAGRKTKMGKKDRVLGYSLAALGLASIATSVGLHVRSNALGRRYVVGPFGDDRADQWKRNKAPTYIMATLGGSALASSLVWLLPPRTVEQKPWPWWSLSVGAAGVALAGYGLYEGLTLGSCRGPAVDTAAIVAEARDRVSACTDRTKHGQRVALAFAGAVPLITFPLIYGLRKPKTKATVVQIRGSMLFFESRF